MTVWIYADIWGTEQLTQVLVLFIPIFLQPGTEFDEFELPTAATQILIIHSNPVIFQTFKYIS